MFLRLIWVMLRVPFQPKLGPLKSPLRLTFRALPTDLGPGGRVSLPKLSGFMDVGIVTLLVRTGVLKQLRRRKWLSVVVAKTVEPIAPIRAFHRFELETTYTAWRGTYTFFEHTVRSGGTIAAKALTVGRIIDPGHPAPSEADILKTMDMVGHTSPPLTAQMEALYERLEAAKPFHTA